MPGGDGRGRAVRPTLTSLPVEVLIDIVKASMPTYDGDDKKSPHYDMTGFIQNFPTKSPITHINSAINRAVLQWAYGTSTFTFYRDFDELYFDNKRPLYAGAPILTWLRNIGSANRKALRRLRLTIRAQELLLLFATTETKVLLNLPSDRHVWAECQSMLEDLDLTHLHIWILWEPLPKAVCLPVWKRLLDVDHRWIVKAVTQTFAHVPTCSLKFTTDDDEDVERAEVDMINSMSWTMLQSDTPGYYRSMQLTWPDDPGPNWLASPDDPVVTPYRIPISPRSRMSNRGGSGYTPFLDGLAFL